MRTDSSRSAVHQGSNLVRPRPFWCSPRVHRVERRCTERGSAQFVQRAGQHRGPCSDILARGVHRTGATVCMASARGVEPCFMKCRMEETVYGSVRRRRCSVGPPRLLGPLRRGADGDYQLPAGGDSKPKPDGGGRSIHWVLSAWPWPAHRLPLTRVPFPRLGPSSLSLFSDVHALPLLPPSDLTPSHLPLVMC